METVYIAVETNVEVFELYRVLWKQRKVNGIMVRSMTEAIETAAELRHSKTQYLYFISISADDIDFMAQLPLLAESTDAPILIATSHDNEDEHHEAIEKGAFFYGKFCENHEKNIRSVVIHVNRYYHTMEKKANGNVLAYGGVSLSISQRTVCANGVEVDLTTNEFDLLHFFLSNRGTALSYKQIYEEVWKDTYNDTRSDAVKGMVKRLRKKIDGDNEENSIIENVREYGYKIPI